MTLQFRGAGAAYAVTVGRDILSTAGSLFNLRRKVLVVTDDGVPEQYAAAILDQCAEGCLLVLRQGEEGKSLQNVERVLGELLDRGFTRGDAVVAVGGGMTGDLAGFAAACFMRGIEYYNVPTTLLSQVDSSVGGKTAVNFGGVKNVVGAFHHPSGVLVDTATLDTLSPRLFAEGLSEVIKMAATGDAALFRLLENAGDLQPLMPEIIAAALRYKISVVEQDPLETGLRAVLNFGHTIGHAIEAASVPERGTVSGNHGRPWPCEREGPTSVAQWEGWSEAEVSGSSTPLRNGMYYHGEAVAVGMLYMAEGEARERIRALLQKFGLPTADPFTPAQLMTYVLHDKKLIEGRIKTVRVSEIGSFRFEEADAEAIENIIRQFKQQ